jgi:DNA-binding NtrC family response regulator
VNRADNASPGAEPQVAPGQGHVLVVDDEPAVLRFAARVLREEGYVVHEATDGHEALELLKLRMTDVDLVVSDIVMPRVNGVELLQSIFRARPELPVLLMSGYGTAQLAERGIASPCGVLSKPFPPDLLLSEVRRCLRKAA